MTGSDRVFAWGHARAYADRGSLAHRAPAYASWYMRTFAVAGAEMADLPDHGSSCAYPRWFAQQRAQGAEAMTRPRHTWSVDVWPVGKFSRVVHVQSVSAPGATRIVRRRWPGCLSSEPVHMDGHTCGPECPLVEGTRG